MAETFYEILGVSRDATQAEITAAYRDRVLETHPDRSDDPDATEAFKRVTTAEEVLSDATERARYDRLGHDSYVRLANGWSETSSRSTVNSSSDSNLGSQSAETSRRRTAESTRKRTHAANQQSDRGRDTGTGGTGSSHHARQRRRRQRARRAAAETAASWWVDDQTTDHRASASGGASADPQTTRARSQTAGPTGSATDSSGTEDTFRYSVHNWTDEITVERRYQPIGYHTAVFVACLALLYPILVYSSVTPLFPFGINLIVAGCTLVMIGYLLTMPRIAMGVFGCWSLIMTALLPQFATAPLSLATVVVIGAFWGPLGYAVAIWWALRL